MVIETRLSKEAVRENLEKIEYRKLEKRGPFQVSSHLRLFLRNTAWISIYTLSQL